MAELKRVSFKIAKALKEAGYPQDIQEVYKENGEYFVSYLKYSNTFAAPTYLDVWLWLWREKSIVIEIFHTNKQGWFTDLMKDTNADPEEAIISAIEYLAKII